MKIGVVLPTFCDRPDEALRVAADAADLDIDGVFAYDHLWPMKNRNRPALAPFPILSQIAAQHQNLFVGPLVARIGMVTDDVLISQFRALNAVSPGHVIAALGTGDSLSREENDAYGIGFDPPDVRRSHLRTCADVLSAEGFEVWIGGGARATLELAEQRGLSVNLWGASVEALIDQSQRTPVTWAGIVPQPEDETSQDLATERLLRQIAATQATWAVVGWPAPLDILAKVSRTMNR